MKEEDLKNILKESKLEAGEGFKERVMHQIETERALRPKEIKTSTFSPAKNLVVLAVMYAAILLAGLFFYTNEKQSILDSFSNLKIVILIAAISGIFYLISVFDDALKLKGK